MPRYCTVYPQYVGTKKPLDGCSSYIYILMQMHETGNFLKRDYKMKSLFLFKLCCFWGVKFGQKYRTESAVSSKRFNYHQNLGLIFIIGVHVLHPMHGQY